MSNPSPLHPDRDSRWKEIIEVFFKELIAFCLPDLYNDIDFTVPPEFLEQELLKIFPDWSKKGKRINDKLAKVRLKSGQEKWILIHVEAQGDSAETFPERMFLYFYRIFDHHEIPLTALAIYTGNRIPNPSDTYYTELYGTSITYKFNTLHIKDLDEQSLKVSTNPFALAALAGLYVLKSQHDLPQRLVFKHQLVRLLLERNYPREKIVKLFIFIKYIVNLTSKMEDRFTQELKVLLPKDKKMTFEEELKEAEPLIEGLMRGFYGTTIEEERVKIQAEKQKVEAEKQKVEAEKQKVEAEKQKAEFERQKHIIRLFEIINLTPDQIATALELDPQYVNRILKGKGLIF